VMTAEAFDAGGTSITQGGPMTSANTVTVNTGNVTYTPGAAGVTTSLTIGLQLRHATGETANAATTVTDGAVYTGPPAARDAFPWRMIDSYGEDALSDPTLIAVAPNGLIFAYDGGNRQLQQVDPVTRAVTTVAGGGGLDGSNPVCDARDAAFSGVTSIVADANGNVYLADSAQFVVRKLHVAAGQVTTVAGICGSQGKAVATGPATGISLGGDLVLATDLTGNVFIGDQNLSVVWKLDPTSQLSVVAGRAYDMSDSGDGGPATAATLNPPAAMTCTPDGSLIVQTSGGSIRRIDAASGNIATIAFDVAFVRASGSLQATANGDVVAVGASYQVYFVEKATGKVSPIVGDRSAANQGNGGLAVQAGVTPISIGIDDQGALIILDQSSRSLRWVTP